MRKISVFIISLVMCACFLSGCSFKKQKVDLKPEMLQVQEICELATLDCYYHNVATSTKDAGTGIFHIGEKSRAFWIEYDGTASIGIDLSKVKMEIEDEDVTVYIPNAILFSTKVDSSSIKFYIEDDDGWNANAITAEDQSQAFDIAEKNMVDTVNADSALFAKAKERAKELIKNYIEKLGNACDKQYKVRFEDLED